MTNTVSKSVKTGRKIMMKIRKELLMLQEDFWSFKRRLNTLYYDIRSIFFPYNVIKIKSLRRTWTDRDEVMLHACFQILVDFVEKEKPFEWFGDPDKDFKDTKGLEEWEKQLHIDQGKWLKEVKTLYNWWKKDYPAMVAREDYEWFDYVKTEKMLKRLMKIRVHLWT